MINTCFQSDVMSEYGKKEIKMISNSGQQINHKLTLNIIWGALIFSIFIYGFVLFHLGKTMTDSTELHPFAMPFTIVIAIELLINWLVFKKKYAKPITADTDKEQIYQKYFSFSIINWALNESIAIYGFVLTFISEDIRYFLVTGTAALCLNFIMRPNIDKLESIHNINNS
jgi:F0F1-type ATP synthase membrane subunit c/vacuolar-type H+-ATPase subunit K